MSSQTVSLVGTQAPDFTLPDQNGEEVSLESLKGDYVVCYFYPKDDTPGCAKQAAGFRDANAELKAAGAKVVGISILGSDSKKKFEEKYSLNFTLLADEDAEVATRYGVWNEKSMYGKSFMGVERQTFLIDPNGKIVEHWPQAKGSEDHAQEVLDALNAQKQQ